MRPWLAAASAAALAAACALYESDDTFYGDARPTGSETSAKAVAVLADRAAATGIVVVTREVGGYRVLGRVTAEADLIDARSEEAAELTAFFRLVLAAAEKDADALVEVRREMLDDGVARVAARPVGIDAAPTDGTSEPVDRRTVRGYWRGEGTLSDRRFTPGFDRRSVAGKTVRFRGKAIVFRSPPTAP